MAHQLHVCIVYCILKFVSCLVLLQILFRAVNIEDMSSLTKKLFEKLSDKPENIEVNAELLSYFKEFEDLDEYRSVVGSLDNPVSRTENLKKLVFRLYGDHKLKDLDFFKYLVWSGQENLCKLIGYGHKQIEKMMKDKPPQAMDDQRPHLIRGNDTGNYCTIYTISEEHKCN